MSKIVGIYTIKNHKNGKVYVGQSIVISQRLNRHKSYLLKGNHKNSHLQSSFNKYGQSAFTFQVIERVENDVSDIAKHLNEREDYWIAYYKSLDPQFGYNMVDNSTKVNIKRTPDFGKAKGFQSKERFYNHRIVSLSSDEKAKESLWSLVEEHITQNYKVKVKTQGLNTNFFIVIFEKNFECIKYSIHKETLKPTLIVDGQGNRKAKIVVYEIKSGSSEIIHTENSIGDMSRYMNLKDSTRMQLCLSFNKNCGSYNAATVNGRIFVAKEYYNPDIVYMRKWDYNKQVKSLKPKQIFYTILQKDLEGNLIRKYERINDILGAYPAFKRKGLVKCIYRETKTYRGFIFEYQK